MPSLKDLRNRIASVKATQKITKAMQMVAAAKLRRAQIRGGSRASLCGAHDGGARQHRVRRDRSGRRRPAFSPAPERTRFICWSFARPSADCAARSTRPSPVSHAIMRYRLMGEGKTVKIICVGKKGYDVLRRQFAEQIIELIDLRSVRQLGFEQADMIAQKILALFERGRVRRCDLVLLALPLGDRADPDGAADHPGPDRRRRADDRRALRLRARRGEILATLLPRNLTVQIFRALAGERRIRTGRAHERHGQRHPQRGRDDQEADDDLQPVASGDDHQGTDRNHLGRRSALTHIREEPHMAITANKPTGRDHAGHRRRRRRAVRRSPAGDPERARDRRTTATASCSKSPSISAKTPSAASPWTRPKAWCAARTSPTPARRSRCRSAPARSAAS